MKRVLTVVSIILLVLWMGICFCAFAQFGGIQSDEVYARAYGAKGFATLTNALAQIGSNVSRTLVIDGGTWVVSTNVDWPSNIAMKVTHDSSISIATGSVMTLDGVNIVEPANRLMFPGLGIATGPIGNAYAMANWQGDRSFYLAPLIAPSSFATTGDVSSITNDLITIITNGDASTSNGVTFWASNALDTVSNGVTLYTREQIVASNDAIMAILTNDYVEKVTSTVNPLGVATVGEISYTGIPYWGSALALASANGWNTDPTFANGWEHLSNFTIIDDPLLAWDADEHQFSPDRPGRYQITVNVAFNNWAASNFFPLVELALFQNAASNKYPGGDAIMASNTIFIGQASGAGKFVTRLSPSGVSTFKKDIGSTADTWKVFYRIQEDTCSVNFGSASFQYLGSTNL